MCSDQNLDFNRFLGVQTWQVIFANFFLLTTACIGGICIRYPGEIGQRKAFMETRKCIETRIKITKVKILISKNFQKFEKKTKIFRNFLKPLWNFLFRKIRVKNDYCYLSCLDMLLFKWKMILMLKSSQSNFIKFISRDTIMSGKYISNR